MAMSCRKNINKWSGKSSTLNMEFLHNIVICQFEFETLNQQCNSFVMKRNLGRNFPKNLIAGGLE